MGKLFFIMLLTLQVSTAWCKDVKEELQGVTREIEEKKLLLKDTAKKEAAVSGELGKIEKNLRSKETQLQELNRDLRGVEENVARVHYQIDSLNSDVQRRKQDIQCRLVAMYKTGDIGNARIIFSSESFSEMLENIRYMRAVMEYDRKMIAGYTGKIDQLKGLKELQERDAKRKEKIRTSISLKKQEVEADQREKAAFLNQVRKDKKSYQTSLRDLEANARRLQVMVEKLEAISRKSYSDKLEKTADGKVKNLPPLAGKGFSRQKGRLSFPVQGNLISSFGRHKLQEFNSYTFSNGISLSAPSGADIHAIFEGKVIFSEYFKGYGNMVIVDHGGGYYSLYAHASKIIKRAGATVSRNEVLANVGDVDSNRGPMVYFEIRYQGKPVDPGPWFR